MNESSATFCQADEPKTNRHQICVRPPFMRMRRKLLILPVNRYRCFIPAMENNCTLVDYTERLYDLLPYIWGGTVSDLPADLARCCPVL